MSCHAISSHCTMWRQPLALHTTLIYYVTSALCPSHYINLLYDVSPLPFPLILYFILRLSVNLSHLHSLFTPNQFSFSLSPYLPPPLSHFPSLSSPASFPISHLGWRVQPLQVQMKWDLRVLGPDALTPKTG